MKKTIYADNNATTAIAPEVIDVMMPYFQTIYFNPSSMYVQAKGAADAIEGARKTIAHFFGDIEPDQILFTSCATESNNNAIFGAIRANSRRRHIITTAVEHPAIYEVCKDLQRQGYDITFLSVDRKGEIDMKEFVSALREDTLLVSIMHANNETGVIFPVADYARIVKETDEKILFHTDATQSVGKIAINLRDEYRHIDLLSFSGHKLHAPKGIGALYIKRGTAIRPFLLGGHQERGKRGGTENVPYIVGLAKAVQLAAENIGIESTEIRRLRDRLEEGLGEKISFMEINGAGAPRLPNTLNVAVHYVEGEGMLYQLNQHGICASSGSACTSGSLDPSHVLKAMNIPFTAAHGSIRFSLSRYNSEEDVDTIIEVFPEIVASLRKISPYWDQKNNIPRENINLVETLK